MMKRFIEDKKMFMYYNRLYDKHYTYLNDNNISNKEKTEISKTFYSEIICLMKYSQDIYECNLYALVHNDNLKHWRNVFKARKPELYVLNCLKFRNYGPFSNFSDAVMMLIISFIKSE
jgi:hypothetical protein